MWRTAAHAPRRLYDACRSSCVRFALVCTTMNTIMRSYMSCPPPTRRPCPTHTVDARAGGTIADRTTQMPNTHRPTGRHRTAPFVSEHTILPMHSIMWETLPAPLWRHFTFWSARNVTSHSGTWNEIRWEVIEWSIDRSDRITCGPLWLTDERTRQDSAELPWRSCSTQYRPGQVWPSGETQQ